MTTIIFSLIWMHCKQ